MLLTCLERFNFVTNTQHLFARHVLIIFRLFSKILSIY